MEGGLGAYSPFNKILEFRVSEMPFPAFSEGHFLQSNKQENVLLYRQSSSSGYLLFSTRVSDNLLITENQLWSQAIINA